MLKSIVVCDLKNQEKACMGEEDIAKCRRYTMKGTTLHLISSTCHLLIEYEDVLKNKYHKINIIVIYM
jgi:hypothetical protein